MESGLSSRVAARGHPAIRARRQICEPRGFFKPIRPSRHLAPLSGARIPASMGEKNRKAAYAPPNAAIGVCCCQRQVRAICGRSPRTWRAGSKCKRNIASGPNLHIKVRRTLIVLGQMRPNKWQLHAMTVLRGKAFAAYALFCNGGEH
jgi:hypothetical protein